MKNIYPKIESKKMTEPDIGDALLKDLRGLVRGESK